MNQPDQNAPVKEPVRPNIPVGEALELPEDIGWGMWDISVEQACHRAWEILNAEDLAVLQLAILRQGLEKHGLGYLAVKILEGKA